MPKSVSALVKSVSALFRSVSALLKAPRRSSKRAPRRDWDPMGNYGRLWEAREVVGVYGGIREVRVC
jgi:hypothetical protein